MRQNRLEGVLSRNRKHLVLDVALAAFFLVALLFSGLTFGTELPKLSMAPEAARQIAQADRDGVAVTLVAAEANAPRPVDR